MNKSNLSPIEKAVQKNLDRYFSDKSAPTFVVAVSGGMDSMCLLYLFKQLGVPALVSHINYQKRGEASVKDAELVENLAFEWGFDCHISTVDPSEAEGQNFQQWARQIRYNIFRELAKEYDAAGIAVAHHDDDQVETILQKIFRGAGLASWSGMQGWDGAIFRPLLDVSRAEIEQYVEEHAIPYRTDETNLETDFARNLLRNQWLEKLADFFPGWKKNVLRISEQAEDYEHALEWIANRITNSEGIKREDFHSLDAGLQKALVLYLLKEEKPGLEISHDSLGQLDELASLQTGKAIELTAQYSVLRDRDYYVIEAGDQPEFNPVTIEKKQLIEFPFQLDELHVTMNDYSNPNFEDTLYLDADTLSWPITIRRWKSGDVIQPLGMQGHQQVSDHLTNRKISAAYKKQALVIESFEETICAIIFPPIKNRAPIGTISEKIKCHTDTRKCLEIKYRK